MVVHLVEVTTCTALGALCMLQATIMDVQKNTRVKEFDWQ